MKTFFFFLQKTTEGGGDDNHVLSQKETKNKPRTEIHGERVGRSALKLNTDLEVKALPLRLGKPTDVQDAHSINKYGRKSIRFKICSLDLKYGNARRLRRTK